jgi:hypothetical protein
MPRAALPGNLRGKLEFQWPRALVAAQRREEERSAVRAVKEGLASKEASQGKGEAK